MIKDKFETITEYVIDFLNQDNIESVLSKEYEEILKNDTFYQMIEKNNGGFNIFFGKVVDNKDLNGGGRIKVLLIGYNNEKENSDYLVECYPVNSKYKLVVPRKGDYILVFYLRKINLYFYYTFGTLDIETITNLQTVTFDDKTIKPISEKIDVLYLDGNEKTMIVGYDTETHIYSFNIKQGGEVVSIYKEGDITTTVYTFTGKTITSNTSSFVARADKTETSINEVVENLNKVWKQIIDNHIHAGGHQTLTSLGLMPLIPVSPDMQPKLQTLNPKIDVSSISIKVN